MWLIATGSSDSVRPRSGTEASGRLKVGATARALCGGLLRRPCRTQARAQPFLRCVPAALLQLILQRGDGLLGAGLVQMAARRTGHANRTKGFIAGLQGHAAQHHGQQHAKAVHTEALTL